MMSLQVIRSSISVGLSTLALGLLGPGCAASVGPQEEIVEASDANRAGGWSHYLFTDANGAVDIQVFLDNGDIAGTTHYEFLEQNSLLTRIQLAGSPEVVELNGTTETFVVHLDGIEVARRENGSLVAITALESITDELEFLATLSSDTNVYNELEERRHGHEEQAAVCLDDATADEGGDPSDGERMFSGPDEQGIWGDICAYGACSLRIIAAEAAVLTLAAAVVALAAGGVPACAGAVATVAGTAACLAGAGAALLGLGRGVGTACEAIKAACTNNCIAGCAVGDRGDMSGVMCPRGF